MGVMRSCSRWWWRCASPRVRGGGPGGGEVACGDPGAPLAAGPRGRWPLRPSSSLDFVLVWRGSAPSLAAVKEEKIRGYGWCLQKNRVSGQYIVLEASPGPLDLIPWIQWLLGTSRTFMVTPRNAHKSPRSWLGQIDLIWQEFESTSSPTFGIPKLLLYSSVIGGTRASGLHFGRFFTLNHTAWNSPQLSCWSVFHLMSSSSLFGSILKSVLQDRFFRKLQIVP
jgi:hypothetical protein